MHTHILVVHTCKCTQAYLTVQCSSYTYLQVVCICLPVHMRLCVYAAPRECIIYSCIILGAQPRLLTHHPPTHRFHYSRCLFAYILPRLFMHQSVFVRVCACAQLTLFSCRIVIVCNSLICMSSPLQSNYAFEMRARHSDAYLIKLLQLARRFCTCVCVSNYANFVKMPEFSIPNECFENIPQKYTLL